MTKEQLHLFNRLVLAQAYIFSKQAEADKSNMPEIAYKIKTAAFNSFHINKFNDKERDFIKEIAHLPEMDKLKKIQTSAVINILELMRIWTADIPKDKRPTINISDKKLAIGKNHYVMHMLHLRKDEKELHAEKTELIKLSTEGIQIWYNMSYSHIKENYHV